MEIKYDLSFADGIKRLQNDKKFRKRVIDDIKNIPFDEYYIYLGTIQNNKCDDFKILIKQGSGFGRANSKPFEKYLKKDINVFTNLDKTCILISPKKRSNISTEVYANIGTFMKAAPIAQIDNLFKIVAKEVLKKPFENIWVSTHGHGVGWLHIRIDSKPKYLNWVNFGELQECEHRRRVSRRRVSRRRVSRRRVSRRRVSRRRISKRRVSRRRVSKRRISRRRISRRSKNKIIKY